MPGIWYLSGHRDGIDLDFVERERAPESAMALGIQSHVAGLSLSNTVELLDALDVQRSRKAVHGWVQKADLQPDLGKSPNQVVLDETVIRINDQQFWLYAAAEPQLNQLLHVRLFATTTTALKEVFLRELQHNHNDETAVFLVNDAQHLQTALQRTGPRFQMCRHGNRNAVEQIFRELKRRTSSFSNCFSHAEPKTAENWLQALD